MNFFNKMVLDLNLITPIYTYFKSYLKTINSFTYCAIYAYGFYLNCSTFLKFVLEVVYLLINITTINV